MAIYKTKYDSNIFKQCRIKSGHSQKEIATILDVSPSTVSKWESGSSLPDQSILPKIADLYGVSVDYLLGRTEESNIAGGYVPENIVAFPVIGSVRAGYDGMIQEYDTGEFIPIPVEFLHGRCPKDFMVFAIKGDSMYPRLLDGDRVLVLRTDSVDSGKTAVIIYNGDEATVKKVIYKQDEDWLDLVPANPEYATKHIVGADLEQCRVIGEVRLLLRTEI